MRRVRTAAAAAACPTSRTVTYRLVFGERRAAAHTTADSGSSNAGSSSSSGNSGCSSTIGGDSQARGVQAGPGPGLGVGVRCGAGGAGQGGGGRGRLLQPRAQGGAWGGGAGWEERGRYQQVVPQLWCRLEAGQAPGSVLVLLRDTPGMMTSCEAPTPALPHCFMAVVLTRWWLACPHILTSPRTDPCSPMLYGRNRLTPNANRCLQLVDGQTPSFTGNVAWWGVVREGDMTRAGARWPAGLEVDSEAEAAGQTRWNVYLAEQPRILMCIRVVGGKPSWFFRCPAAKLREMGLEFPGGACCGVLFGYALQWCRVEPWRQRWCIRVQAAGLELPVCTVPVPCGSGWCCSCSHMHCGTCLG